jgi:hypothetical protein
VATGQERSTSTSASTRAKSYHAEDIAAASCGVPAGHEARGKGNRCPVRWDTDRRSGSRGRIESNRRYITSGKDLSEIVDWSLSEFAELADDAAAVALIDAELAQEGPAVARLHAALYALLPHLALYLVACTFRASRRPRWPTPPCLFGSAASASRTTWTTFDDRRRNDD